MTFVIDICFCRCKFNTVYNNKYLLQFINVRKIKTQNSFELKYPFYGSL